MTTLLTLHDDDLISSDDERGLLLGVEYDVPADRRLEAENDIGTERERYDDQILAGLLCPW